MIRENLKEDIVKEKASLVVSKWVFERIPFLFNNDLEKYIIWKEKLSSLIGVDSKAITLSGSAAVGISLNPDKNFKEFDSLSDIDVSIISNHYFDVSWHCLRNMGTKIYKLTTREKIAVEDHTKRLIYWGTIATDKIIQILPFGAEWLSAIDEMKKLDPTLDREINFRIYKDFESLRAYQKGSINKLRDLLLNEKKHRNE